MATITTARILADKALERTCGQECVDWAISMLEQGRDGRFLTMLAGMSPPFNSFEMADYRDRALRELSLSDLSGPAAVTIFAAEHLRLALNGEADLISTLTIIKDLCIAHDYQRDIYDFYSLYFAYTDLQESEVQWYWDGATRENIVSIIRTRAEAFLQSHDSHTTPPSPDASLPASPPPLPVRFCNAVFQFVFPSILYRGSFFLRMFLSNLGGWVFLTSTNWTESKAAWSFLAFALYQTFFILLPRMRDVGMGTPWLIVAFIPFLNNILGIVLLLRPNNSKAGALRWRS